MAVVPTDHSLCKAVVAMTIMAPIAVVIVAMVMVIPVIGQRRGGRGDKRD